MDQIWADKKEKNGSLICRNRSNKKSRRSLCPNVRSSQTIISVYEVLVDAFDKEKTYLTCTYFLLMGIMHICPKEENLQKTNS